VKASSDASCSFGVTVYGPSRSVPVENPCSHAITDSCIAAAAHVRTRTVAAEKAPVVSGLTTTAKACESDSGTVIEISSASEAFASTSAHSLTVMPACALTWAKTTTVPSHLSVQAANTPSRK